MNIYAVAPLIATIAFIPVLLTTMGSRPWQTRHKLFILFVIPTMMWSLSDFFWRSHSFPEHTLFLMEMTLILFYVMAIQFHCFTSSFFRGGYRRWLPFAYGSLVLMIVLTLQGFVVVGFTQADNKFFPEYGIGILLVAVPLVILVARNLYVFKKMLNTTDSPVLRNQIVTLIISIVVITFFTMITILPWGREYPVSHYGNLVNAFILNYAVIRHQLVDIKFFLRQAAAWMALAIIGVVAYVVLFFVLNYVFGVPTSILGTFLGIVAFLTVLVVILRVRRPFIGFMTRAFQGSNYEYRKKLGDFTDKIHNVFSLKEQGGELLSLLIRAVNVREACLLFPELDSDDFATVFVEPHEGNNNLAGLRLRAGNPIIKYLEKEQKTLTRENLNILPSFLGLWAQEKEEIEAKEIELFMPLISRDKLIAILVLGKKESGRYSLEDFGIIEDVTSRVAVSMEKEYLREQLREREEELSVINSSSVILSSSLEIQEIFGSFLEELKKVIDVHWASIVLTESDELRCMALSSPEGSAYQVGECVPLDGTGSGWVITYKKSFIESDLSQEKHFDSSEHFYQQGLRTIVYLPLISKGVAIGSFLVASRRPNAYHQRHVRLLEQLASQIAMPLENSQLYAQAEKKARVDELTSLFNRRSLDEMIDEEISRHSRYGGSFTLAIMDLDSFKAFNDTYGHPAGDRLLRQVGECIRDAIRTSDRAFRYGGDEFAILLPQTDTDAALLVTERVRKKIANDLDTGDIPVSASIGMASWPEDGIGHTDIIAAADVTLYRAKRNGGNRSYRASGTLAPLQVSNVSVKKNGEMDGTILSLIQSLSEAVDSRNGHPSNHSKRVADYALAMAKILKFDEVETSKLVTCAFLHDIGQIGISDVIMNKPYSLTAEEWEEVKNHPRMGADIVKKIPQLSHCVDGILHHHERYDGTGYPDGLKGEAIPQEARILAICDAFVAMTSEKSYSDIVTHEHALYELKRCAGTQFDPFLVEQFILIHEPHNVQQNNNTGGKAGGVRKASSQADSEL